MPLPTPAPVSTSTSWPLRVSSRTPAGVMATRYSRVFVSLGTPTFMRKAYTMLTQMKRLEWVRRLQTITQAGLTYSRDPFDRERFQQLQELAAEIAADDDDEALPSVLALLRAEAGYA